MSPFLDIGRKTQLSFERYYCHLHLSSIYTYKYMINDVKFVCDIMIYWAAEKIVLRYDWALMEVPFVFINFSLLKCFWQKAEVKNWQCCLKRKPRAITFLSTFFGFCFRQDILYQHYFSYLLFYLHLLGIFYSHLHVICILLISERNYPAPSIRMHSFSRLLSLRCCNFCWLNILLFQLFTLSHITTMFDTVNVSTISNISGPGNVSVIMCLKYTVIMCLKYTVIPTPFCDGVNNLRALCHTSGS